MLNDTGSRNAAFAAESAISFPFFPTWPGSQHITISIPSFDRTRYFSRICEIRGLESFMFAMDLRQDIASENVMYLLCFDVDMYSNARSIAFDSAEKIY